MNGFMVVERHATEQFPVALVPDRDEAFRIAVVHEPMTEAWELWCKRSYTDCASPLSIEIVEFRDGLVYAVEEVKGYE